ncbi:hypothetical protein FACS18949_02450 [Clostridia bacterium]|nr:hypothetical protein FACS18949_02450 [Clostridia bacterium]
MRKLLASRVLPILFAAAALLPLAFLIFAVRDARATDAARTDVVALEAEIRAASAELTALARRYVQYGDDAYRESYLRKYNDKDIVARLRELSASLRPDETILAEHAATAADLLSAIDLRAFALYGGGHTEAARELLFSHEYTIAENLFRDARGAFSAAAGRRFDREDSANARVFQIAVGVCAGAAVLLIWLFASLSSYYARRGRELTAYALAADKIAEGVSVPPVVERVRQEYAKLVHAAQSGDTSAVDLSEFSGVWRELMEHANTLLSVVGRNLTAASPIVCIRVADGVVLDCNAAAYRLLGLTAGAELSECFFEEEFRELRDLIAREGIADGFTARMGASGNFMERRRFRLNVVPSADDPRVKIFWATDIESEEQRLDVTRKGREDITETLDALPVAVLINDPATTEIFYANEAYAAMFQFPPHADIQSYPERNMYEDAGTLFSDDKPCECVYITHTGKRIEASVITRNIRYSHRKAHIKIVLDVGVERKLNEELRETAARERSAHQMKSRFIVNMSHEFRTPMNAIVGMSQMALLREQEDENNANAFRKINRSAHQLMGILDDVLDFLKIEGRQLLLEEAEFNLTELLSQARTFLADRADNRFVETRVDAAPEVPYLLYGDRTRLWQCLRNLLDNASRYTPRGQIKLQVTVESPSQLRHTDRAWITFAVRDTGVGMTEQQLSRLFIPFAQQPDRGYLPHTGLGLSITKELATLMGGDISVMSEPGKGSEFAVRLPFRMLDPDAVMASLVQIEREPERHELPQFTGLRVLLVEDNMLNQEVALGMLEMLGIEGKLAEDGQEALKKLSEEPFDLVLMDILMPVMDGLEATRRVRASGAAYSGIPIIALTANVLKEHVDEFKDAGMNRYIPKPIEFDSLVAELRRFS